VFALSFVPYFGDTIIFTSVTGGNTYDFTLRSALWIACLFLGWSRRLVIASGRGKTHPAK